MLSFWDIVRNPKKMFNFERGFREVEKGASRISGSEAEVARLVNYFVFEAPSLNAAWTEKQTLASLGEEAYPVALEILRNPALRAKLIMPVGHESPLPEAPINRLCAIFDLGTPPPPEAAELLASFLESDSPEIRKSIALIIGSIGSEEALRYLHRALMDEDGYVRAYALMGVERAFSGARIDPASRVRYFDLVAAMWPEDTCFNVCRSLPSVLLQLDRDRAVERLSSPDLLTTGFSGLSDILGAFVQKSVKVSRSRLLPLIDVAGREPIGRRMDSVLGALLTLLGEHRMQEDLPTLEGFVDHENEWVSRGAIEGIYLYHRHRDLVRDPWQVWETDGWDSLTDAEKHICAITGLDGEVGNGGFAQYFFNSSGDHWEDALKGLAAIGAEERHRILAATTEKFGKTPPSSKRARRMSQLSKLVRRKEDSFNEQDTACYKAASLDRLLFRYNLEHTEGRLKAQRRGP